MTDVANAGGGVTASAPAAAKAAPEDPWALPDVSHLVVGVVGGTGDQGRGLAYRLARAGQRMILGSRAADRARRAAAELGHDVEGADNAECARRSDIVIVAVPWDGHAEILQSLRTDLAGKLVVDCVNPLGCEKQGAYALTMPKGSAAQQAAARLPESQVTAAFHHLGRGTAGSVREGCPEGNGRPADQFKATPRTADHERRPSPIGAG
jgi:8-hydroxy-5-deazaflavin:NADPH oxidoreductase